MQPQNSGEPVKQNSDLNPSGEQPQVYSPPGSNSGLGGEQPGTVIAPAKSSRRKLFVLGGAAVVLVTALAAYALVYYLPNKPERVWRSALSTTSYGYRKLVDYAADDKQAKQYEIADVDGTFAYSSEGLEVDGTVKVKSDNKNAAFSGDIGIGLTRVNFDGVVKDAANSDSPDMYVKVKGIKGLGGLAGMSQLDSLDDRWIALDHTFFDSLVAGKNKAEAEAEGGAGLAVPAKADVVEAAEAVGKVSDKYLFTTRADAVLKMSEYVGAEKLDGKDTKHFKVKANKANLKRYLEELGKELDATKLNEWAEDTFNKSLSKQLNLEDAIKAADELTGDETFDAWVNTDTKLLHKVHFTDAENPKDNYLDLVLNFDGGNYVPLSIAMHGKDSVARLDMSINMDTNVVKLSVGMEDSSEDNASTGSFGFTVKPGSGKVDAKTPEGAISLPEALSLIGLDGYLNLLTSSLEDVLQ